MNKLEINEIKKRFKPDYNNINHIYGVFVNSSKNIVSSFDASLTLMEQEEKEMYLALLKKSLSGTLGRNLLNIEFSSKQVIEGSEHTLLMNLNDTALKDEEYRKKLIENIIQCTDLGDNDFLILLASDRYDVPYKDKNDELLPDSSGQIFDYFICAVCPVKPAKSELKYDSENMDFRSISSGHIAQNPEMAFMFPSFDDRATNIYSALYYVKNPDNIHQAFIDTIFQADIPMSAEEQKNSFAAMIEDALGEDCSFQVVQQVNDEIIRRVEEHKEAKIPTALELSRGDMGDILQSTGVKEENIEDFREKYADRYGDNGTVKPDNVISTKKFTVETPEVKISVSQENSHYVTARVIDGRKYILIPAGGEVKVNGILVNISDLEEQ